MQDPAPVNPLPPVVWLLFLAIALPEAAFQAGSAGIAGGPGAVGWRLQAIQDYGFNGTAFDWMQSSGQWPAEHVARFVTYAFVHPAATATLFSAVMLLALGKLVGEVMGQLAVLSIFFCASVAGAAVIGLVSAQEWLLGAFPGVYGLIGGYTFIMWLSLGARGEEQLRAFSLIALLMGIQLLFGIFFDTGLDWIADLTGFACGFGLSLVLIPGGWQRLLERVRNR